jgi:hypothetical protein
MLLDFGDKMDTDMSNLARCRFTELLFALSCGFLRLDKCKHRNKIILSLSTTFEVNVQLLGAWARPNAFEGNMLVRFVLVLSLISTVTSISIPDWLVEGTVL